MPLRKRKHSSKFKFQVAIAALKSGNATQAGREYEVTSGMAHKWYKHLLEQGHSVFDTTPNQEIRKLKQHITKLEQMLGKKEVELGLIKNFTDFYESHPGA